MMMNFYSCKKKDAVFFRMLFQHYHHHNHHNHQWYKKKIRMLIVCINSHTYNSRCNEGSANKQKNWPEKMVKNFASNKKKGFSIYYIAIIIIVIWVTGIFDWRIRLIISIIQNYIHLLIISYHIFDISIIFCCYYYVQKFFFRFIFNKKKIINKTKQKKEKK